MLPESLALPQDCLHLRYDWDPTKFHRVAVPPGYWKQISNQRTMLDGFALKLNIMSPEGWYSVKNEDLLKEPGGSSVLKVHKWSIYKMLKDVYPEYLLNVQLWNTLII
jgi:hypothetical protein